MVTALHVTSCQDEFRQQQIAMLWRASGAKHTQVAAHTHTHTLCSDEGFLFLPVLLSVSAEASCLWACEDSWFTPDCCTVLAVRHINFSVCASASFFLFYPLSSLVLFVTYSCHFCYSSAHPAQIPTRCVCFHQ